MSTRSWGRRARRGARRPARGPGGGGRGVGGARVAVDTACARVVSAALRARDALLVGSAGWIVAAALIVAFVLPAPGRTSAMAATAFGLSIAGGMALSALVGLGRVGDLVSPGGQVPQLRRVALVAPLALAVAAVPGMLVAKALVTSDTGVVLTVVVGVLAAIVSAVVALPLLALGDPRLARAARDRLRRRGAGAGPTGPTETAADPSARGAARPARPCPGPCSWCAPGRAAASPRTWTRSSPRSPRPAAPSARPGP